MHGLYGHGLRLHNWFGHNINRLRLNIDDLDGYRLNFNDVNRLRLNYWANGDGLGFGGVVDVHNDLDEGRRSTFGDRSNHHRGGDHRVGDGTEVRLGDNFLNWLLFWLGNNSRSDVNRADSADDVEELLL